MCFNSKKNFIKNFKQFENNLPDIKEETIEFPLKKLIYIIKEKIDGTIKEGENKYNFDFSQEKSLPIKFNLTINYTISEENDYGGNIDYNEIKRTNFSGFNLEINIQDKDIDYTSVYSTIGHELKHVFDLYVDSPYMRADKMEYIYYLMNKYKNECFYNMLYLAYISLKYEMDAKNSEIYNKLRWLKTFDNSMIMDEFKKTYVYGCLKELENFDVDKVLSDIDSNKLIEFLEEYKLIFNFDEISVEPPKKFLIMLKAVFNRISKLYFDKAKEVLEEIIRDNRPYMEKIKHPFYYEHLYLLRVNWDVDDALIRIKDMI
jgi:hypothetical protein